MPNDDDGDSLKGVVHRLRPASEAVFVPKSSGKPRGRVLTDAEEADRQRAMREREHDYVRKIVPTPGTTR